MRKILIISDSKEIRLSQLQIIKEEFYWYVQSHDFVRKYLEKVTSDTDFLIFIKDRVSDTKNVVDFNKRLPTIEVKKPNVNFNKISDEELRLNLNTNRNWITNIIFQIGTSARKNNKDKKSYNSKISNLTSKILSGKNKSSDRSKDELLLIKAAYQDLNNAATNKIMEKLMFVMIGTIVGLIGISYFINHIG